MWNIAQNHLGSVSAPNCLTWALQFIYNILTAFVFLCLSSVTVVSQGKCFTKCFKYLLNVLAKQAQQIFNIYSTNKLSSIICYYWLMYSLFTKCLWILIHLPAYLDTCLWIDTIQQYRLNLLFVEFGNIHNIRQISVFRAHRHQDNWTEGNTRSFFTHTNSGNLNNLKDTDSS